jgi:hypothetical protein
MAAIEVLRVSNYLRGRKVPSPSKPKFPILAEPQIEKRIFTHCAQSDALCESAEARQPNKVLRGSVIFIVPSSLLTHHYSGLTYRVTLSAPIN